MRGRSPFSFGWWGLDSAVPPVVPEGNEIRFTQFYNVIARSVLPLLPPEPASPCTGGGGVALAADPAEGASLANARTPLLWGVFHLDSGDVAVSFLPLADASTYHAGFKEPRLIMVGRPRYARSDNFGGLQASSVDVQLVDTDRRYRGLMRSTTLLNREFDIWMADDATRRAEGVARRIGHFVITNFSAVGDFTFHITGSGFIGSVVSRLYSEARLDLPLYSRSYFSQISKDLENTPIKPVYGFVTDESLPTSADGPVVLDPTQGVGGFLDGGLFPDFGWIDDIPVAAPASLTTGTTGGGSFGNTTLYLAVSAVVGGVESNLFPVDGSGVSQAITSGQALTGSTGSVTGATAYRWYCSDSPPANHAHISMSFSIMKETATPSVTISSSTDGTPYNMPPLWCVVVALMPDGVTVPQRSTVNDTGVTQYEGFIKLGPYPERKTRIGWDLLVGATEYWIYIRGATFSDIQGGMPRSYNTRFIVDGAEDHFDYGMGMVGEAVTGTPGTETELGAVLLDYIGEMICPDDVVRSAFVGSLGAVGNIQSLFGSDGGVPTPERMKIPDGLYGVTVFCPHKTGWFYPTNYVEVTNADGEALWVTMVFVDSAHPIAIAAKDGTIPITANMCGLTETSDGSDETISDGILQALHVLENWGPREDGGWRSGDWKGVPTRNGVPIWRTSSFEAVKAKWEGLVDGGAQGAFVIGTTGESPLLFDFLSAVAANYDIEWVEDHHGACRMVFLDTDDSAVADFSDVRNIPEHGDISTGPVPDSYINWIVYHFKQNYIEAVTKVTPPEAELLPPKLADNPPWYSGDLEVKSQSSFDLYLYGWKKLIIEFTLLRTGSVPLIVVTRKLARLAFPLENVLFPASLLGLDVLPGQIVTFSHAAGAGASGATNRRIYISSIEVDAQMSLSSPNSFDTWIQGEDITDLSL